MARRQAAPDASPGIPTPIVMLLALLVFAADFHTPGTFAHGTLYIPCILLATLRRDRRSVASVAALCAVLLVAYIPFLDLAAPAPGWRTALANHLLMLLLLLATTLACLRLLDVLADRDQALARASAHQAALEVEQRLRRIACQAGALGGWSVDVATGDVQVSDFAARIQGYREGYSPTIDEAIAIYAPEDQVRVRRLYDACASAGHAFDEEFQVFSRVDQRWLWVRVIAHPVRDADGRIVQVHGATQDISERKRLQSRVAAANRWFAQVADSLPLVVFSASAEGEVEYLNHRGLDYMGLQSDQLRGAGSGLGIAHPDDRAAAATAWERGLQAGEAFQLDYRMRDHMGHYRWHQVRARPVRALDGSIERWVGSATDIHDLRQDDSRRRLLEAAIAQINDIVLITEARPLDVPGPRIVFVNRAFERRMGFPAQEVIGQTPRLLQGADTSRTERGRIRAALEAGEPVRATLDNYTRSGDKVVLELDIAPVHDASGALTHFVSVERDVTQQAAMQARLEQAQRLESIGQLTGGMAHDFNNLLTVIMGGAELLVESLPGADRPHELAVMIAGASERAAGLVQRLLAFARQQVLEPGAVDVPALVRAQMPLLGHALGEGVALHLSVEPELTPAWVDPGQLESALFNLCTNARQAMPDGGRVDLAIAMCDVPESAPGDLEDGRYLRLTVADTGNGIAPEHVPRVFEPFFTTRQSAGSTGLGLSMVYGFARQSRGHVCLDTAPGAGTRVHLYLPAAPAESAASAAGEAQAGAPPAEQGRRTILVVDDDDLVRDHACEQLGALGYEVLAVRDGAAALRVLQSGAPLDLVFSDVAMPGISGHELARQAHALRPALPVLLTSGYPDAGHADMHETYPLLGKPYRTRELADAVERLLAQASRGAGLSASA